LAAGLVDFLLIVFVVNAAIDEEFFYNSDEFINGEPSCEHVCQAWKLIAYTAVFVPYGLVTEAVVGRTLGKALFGLRVERDGQRAGLRRTLARNSLRIFWLFPLPGLGLVADVIMIAFADGNQRLGDMVAGTRVVRRPVRWRSAPLTRRDVAADS
jgi:uncharacterized RDD family membrane protein YckC